jgi:hypothetical protein
MSGKTPISPSRWQNLEPEAEVTRQIYEEYKNGNMEEAAFQRLIEKQTLSSESAILISDALGKIVIVRNIGSTVEMQDFGEYYRAEMQNVLRGQTVENSDLKLLNGETAVSVGISPFVTQTETSPAVFLVIKHTDAFRARLTSSITFFPGTILITCLWFMCSLPSAPAG